MSTPEYDSMTELLADCAAIPDQLTEGAGPGSPPAAAPWEVDDTCLEQVRDLDEYV